ncbi:MAG: ketopantoate reductase family protein [Lachnospiraceae bacterium]|nr:ketopantoate reductase family protein [Lachnospiraceae bacterium]
MKILVFGVGAIGSLMTHFLCEAGNDVTVVARSTYEELNNNGLVIRHRLQRKTTVDHLRVLKEADDAHYDIVFSVMQGQQQLALLPVLKTVDADLIVLVGNNMETGRCEEALKDRHHLYGFQGSAGHREGGVTVAGRMSTTDLTVGGLDCAPSESDVAKLRKAFDVKGYKITPVDHMYAYYMYHIAEIMPYCYLSYHLDCDLRKATKHQIDMIMAATKECFDYLKEQGIPVMPAGEDDYYDSGAKTTAMRLLYRVMSKTILGELMVSDHCKNGIKEMKYLDGKFEEYREFPEYCFRHYSV